MFSWRCPRRRATRPGRQSVMSATAAAVAVAVAVAVAISGCESVQACSCGRGRSALVVRDNANGATIPVHVGDLVKVILSSSYWNFSGSSAPRVLRQDGPVVLLARPRSCADIAGLGCTPVRVTFTALAGGTAVISASRTTCGEALACAGKQARQFMLTIVVS
jgi:hypothetical protein